MKHHTFTLSPEQQNHSMKHFLHAKGVFKLSLCFANDEIVIKQDYHNSLMTLAIEISFQPSASSPKVLDAGSEMSIEESGLSRML
ncbi:hypothetical protein CJ030_MR7G000152 [Morella rubra]|uniref:Uncharacterized protein n=1 Tax=Morella rubra TaxID=262757 RepID=A0A6A1V650_9ROSI|nr:hypothetical protein CJ030_MR7G000152 [Morella rubra]